MQEKSKEYNEKEQQVAENRSRNTLFERRENLQKHESYASERRPVPPGQYPAHNF